MKSGAWIETPFIVSWLSIGAVAPPVGAWIETGLTTRARWAWWMSLPPWERGLKPNVLEAHNVEKVSLPPWERGLKQSCH